MKILVADDSGIARARLAAIARELPGCEVIEADDAARAVVLATTAAPDIVVVDLQMPGGGALAVLRAAKLRRPPPIVLVVTASDTEQHRRICLAQRADGVFDKALEFPRVVDELRRLTRLAP